MTTSGLGPRWREQRWRAGAGGGGGAQGEDVVGEEAGDVGEHAGNAPVMGACRPGGTLAGTATRRSWAVRARRGPAA
jgi:hypothetical protein